MKFKVAPGVMAISSLSALILSTPSAAQEHKRKLSHYALTDLGTLGGSFSFAGELSNSGWVIGVDSNGDTHAFLLTPTYCDKDDDTATSTTTTRPESNPGNKPIALHGRAQSNRFKNVTPR